MSSLKKSSSGSLETPAKKHTRLSALEKFSLCKAVRDRMEAGESSWAAVRAESLKQHVHTRTGLRIWQDREYWQEWTEKFQPGKHARRKQGQRTSMSKLAARGRGCNKPGSRGYLGRKQHMRCLVLQVKAWADAETVRGKSLARLDLLMRLLELLRLAVKAGEQNAESLTPEEVARLGHWKKRLAGLESEHHKRDWMGRYLVRETGFLERQTQRTTKCSLQEENARLVRAWLQWDW
ncbi:MAG: hypothetical protein GY772_20550, partial [bacterium]|nr:hypothetical protein [bacterium]